MENQKPVVKRNGSTIIFETEEDSVWCRPCTDAPNEVAEWMMETFPYLDDVEISALVAEGWELAEAEEINQENTMEYLHVCRIARRMAEIIEG